MLEQVTLDFTKQCIIDQLLGDIVKYSTSLDDDWTMPFSDYGKGFRNGLIKVIRRSIRKIIEL